MDHSPWIDSIRGTKRGGIVLGLAFVWSDPACYSIGLGLGILIVLTGRRDRSAPGT